MMGDTGAIYKFSRPARVWGPTGQASMAKRTNCVSWSAALCNLFGACASMAPGSTNDGSCALSNPSHCESPRRPR